MTIHECDEQTEHRHDCDCSLPKIHYYRSFELQWMTSLNETSAPWFGGKDGQCNYGKMKTSMQEPCILYWFAMLKKSVQYWRWRQFSGKIVTKVISVSYTSVLFELWFRSCHLRSSLASGAKMHRFIFTLSNLGRFWKFLHTNFCIVIFMFYVTLKRKSRNLLSLL